MTQNLQRKPIFMVSESIFTFFVYFLLATYTLEKCYTYKYLFVFPWEGLRHYLGCVIGTAEVNLPLNMADILFLASTAGSRQVRGK